MDSLRRYLNRIRSGIFHRGETFAMEGGISFGPGSDPKGSFYNSPRVSIYWHQPESVVLLEEEDRPGGLVKTLLSRFGGLKRTA